MIMREVCLSGWPGVLFLALMVGCKSKESSSTTSSDPPKAQASASAKVEVSAPAKPTCPEGMVHLPGGRFLRGSEQGPQDGYLDERPPVQVEVKPFCLDKTEVTVEAYATCVDASACTKPKEKDPPYVWPDQLNWGKADRKNHPVNGVSISQAQAYCKHAGKRLIAEVEWEFAARGTQNRPHPWGADEPSSKLLNVCDPLCRAEGKKHQLPWIAIYEAPDGFAYTAPVGSFPAGATPEGVLDLEGNVSEWVEGAPCPYDKPECGEKGAIYRGTAWGDQFKGLVKSSLRHRSYSGEGYASVGFRCAK